MIEAPRVEGQAEEARWSIPTRELRRFRVPVDGRLAMITLESDEVTTLDKVSNRPDFLTVRIEYVPGDWVLGSRSLRLYYQSLRDYRTSVEGVAATIAHDVEKAIAPKLLRITVSEKARGGIAITAIAEPDHGSEDPYDAWVGSH